jgi:hypothetical protein
MDDYIAKPITGTLLIELVERVARIPAALTGEGRPPGTTARPSS